MGYYTRFNLTIISGEDYEIDYNEEINKISDYDDCFEEEIKWYDHEKDMTELSVKHPEVLFLLEGEGEETGDFWKEYYKNGKSYRIQGEVTFEEFDETKMK